MNDDRYEQRVKLLEARIDLANHALNGGLDDHPFIKAATLVVREEVVLPTKAPTDSQLKAVRAMRGARAPEPERILCAAIYVDDGIKHERLSENYPETGLLFPGWRHGDCFVALNAWADCIPAGVRAEIGEEQIAGKYQGFLTSKGRFVGREEAAKIAFVAGQINRRKEGLDSEDLY